MVLISSETRCILARADLRDAVARSAEKSIVVYMDCGIDADDAQNVVRYVETYFPRELLVILNANGFIANTVDAGSEFHKFAQAMARDDAAITWNQHRKAWKMLGKIAAAA